MTLKWLIEVLKILANTSLVLMAMVLVLALVPNKRRAIES